MNIGPELPRLAQTNDFTAFEFTGVALIAGKFGTNAGLIAARCGKSGLHRQCATAAVHYKSMFFAFFLQSGR